MPTEAGVTTAPRLDQALLDQQDGNEARAAATCRELLAVNPRNQEALLLLGRIMQAAGRRARTSLDGTAVLRDVTRDGSPVAVHEPEHRWMGEAEEIFRRILADAPEHADAWRGLGGALLNQARFGEAIETLRCAAGRLAGNIDVQIALADAQRAAGDYVGAVDTLERLVAQNPEHVFSHLQLFATLYIQGDMRRGWAQNEWRMFGETPDLPQPVWDGSPLAGRTILLRAEQGLGDQLQFIRFAPALKERGARVVAECHAPLTRLLQTCPGIDQVVTSGDELPGFDLQVWPGSLPHLLETTLDTIPAPVPYIAADPLQVERWRKLLAKFTGLRIGINWAGNRYNIPGHNREIPLAGFFGLGRTEGVHLFSLQKGEGTESLAEVPGDVRIFRMGQFFGDLYDTAALVETMDLVITNDTSIAHLAGALGRPVWVMLPRQACWRWQRGREDCPWYPTMRLFRQAWTSPWRDVFRQVESAVTELLAERSRPAVRFRGVTNQARTIAAHA